MRIAIDARAAAEEPGGRGRLVRELLRALSGLGAEHQYALLARQPWHDRAVDDDPRFSWIGIGGRDPLWHAAAARWANRHADVLYSTNSYLTAWLTRIPCAILVHDLIAFRRDSRPQRRAAVIERATAPLGVRRAAALVANSRSTARDVAHRWPGAGDHCVVAPLAADRRFFDAPDPTNVLRERGIDRPYVLAVGTLEPRKNLPRLINAFVNVPAGVRGERLLVLVGATGWQVAKTQQAIGTHSETVRALGRVSDDDLAALYRGADLFAYPSLYEGFGLPVLEAMAAGTAVLTSNVSSLPEVAGEVGFYVDPQQVDSIRQGLTQALSDENERRRRAAAGRHRARDFSWQRHAAITLALLERLAASG